MLQNTSNGTENDWYISLSRFCSDEQLNLIYRTFRSEIKGSAIFVDSEIKGYIDDFGQWIPQKLILSSHEDKSKPLELDFVVESSNNRSLVSQSFESQTLWIAGPGSYQRTPTKADQKILKKCDDLAIRNIGNAVENQLGTGGMCTATYMEFDGVGTITIDGETYYFAIGGQGFPRRAAISELKLFYIFLLAVMLLLFLMVSRGFAKQYKRQIALETERRKLTLDAAVQLKEPLTVIYNCGKELQQFVPDEKRTELLDTIINKTEQMDITVRNLLTSVRAGKGKKR